MTLHLNRISKSYSLGVSDRLVSSENGLQDPLSNKNLIYFARDAVVVIAYSGLAYGLSSNKNIPTDEWLAEKLWGKPIARGPDNVTPAAIGFEQIVKWLDIGQSTEVLRNELEISIGSMPEEPRNQPFRVSITGWQLTKHGLFRPIIIEIEKLGGKRQFVINRYPRNWYFRDNVELIEIPNGHLDKNELVNLRNKLQKATIDESEKILIDGIRNIASRQPLKIGANLLSILLPKPGGDPIRVRFIPQTIHTISVGDYDLPVAFSPWVISPNSFFAPSTMVGNTTQQVGDYQIVFEAPPGQKGGLVWYLGAQKRPKFK